MRWALILATSLVASPLAAEMIVPTRTIRPQEIIAAEDLVVAEDSGESNVGMHDLIGQEARVALYPGRPLRLSDVGPPTIITRNQIVQMVYVSVGLEIVTEGRSLERASIGEQVKVMNLGSRNTVSGVVRPDGKISVSE